MAIRTNTGPGTNALAVLEERVEALVRLLHEKELRYEQRFIAQETARDEAARVVEKAVYTTKETLDSALQYAEKAIQKAEAATEKRFESVNEFRNTLVDQQSTFARKTEVEIRFLALEEKVTLVLTKVLESGAQSTGVHAAWIYFLGGLAGLASIAAIVGWLVKI